MRPVFCTYVLFRSSGSQGTDKSRNELPQHLLRKTTQRYLCKVLWEATKTETWYPAQLRCNPSLKTVTIVCNWSTIVYSKWLRRNDNARVNTHILLTGRRLQPFSCQWNSGKLSSGGLKYSYCFDTMGGRQTSLLKKDDSADGFSFCSLKDTSSNHLKVPGSNPVWNTVGLLAHVL